ncbi:MAG TPA: metallophosphoesterase family protein, partial [Proteiniphilum sp.]|nr:metallophosphoesterase family protein [Proteiniphilum sp.]
MKKIGLLSDTHGYWDDKFETYFETCDEIWHAGDIGSLELASRFEEMKPFRAVYGNIDDYKTRIAYPQTLRFTLEKVEVLMTHIGGYPGRYDPSIRAQLQARPPKLFIARHS